MERQAFKACGEAVEGLRFDSKRLTMDPLPRITIRMEGLPEEGGHLRLNDFLARLADWKRVLTELSSNDGQSDLYYRVVNLSHSSPAMIELEPVRKAPKKEIPRSKSSPKVLKRKKDNPMRVIHEIKAIRKKAEVSEDVRRGTLERMESLTPSPSNGIASASIRIGDSEVELNQRFSANLRKLVEGEEFSYGSVEGRIEILNIHGRNFSCHLFPPVGAEKIRCTFPIALKALVTAAVDNFVRVYGRKHFRGSSPFPYLLEIEEIEVLQRSSVVKLSSLGGALTASNFSPNIGDDRDDW